MIRRAKINPFVDEGFVDGHWGSQGSGILFTLGHEKGLFLLRSGSVMDPYVWGIPGGAVPVDDETDESDDVYESALQEAEEELGSIPPGGHSEPWEEFELEADDGFVFTTFVVEVEQDVEQLWRPRLNWENTDWVWLDFEQALRNMDLHPGVRIVLELLKEKNV